MASSRKSVKRSVKKSKSKSKSKSRGKKSLPPALKLWRKVAEKHGFMIKGDFRKLPKKGTKAYSDLKKDYVSAKKHAGFA